ncbi:hypothetical protein, partial [Methylobacterium cerastii]
MSRTRPISVFVLAAALASSLPGQGFLPGQVFLAGQALAQAETGTGGGAASTVTAPNTSRVGRTMPPSTGAGAATADDRRTRTPNEKQDDQLMRGICIG